MKLTTCKGTYNGTVTQCAAWLEMMQPATVSVEVELNNETADVEVETPDGMECGWENTQALRAAIRAAWVQASIECGGQPAV
jgi:hypothetical protein